MNDQKISEISTAAVAVITDRLADFLKKGAALRLVQEIDAQALKGVLVQSGVQERKAYYWIAIDRAFAGLGVPRARLLRIGWTRLKEIVDDVSKENVQELLVLAEKHVVKDLIRVMNGKKEVAGAKSINLRLSVDDYQIYRAALIQHGAILSGRGLEDQEYALMDIIRKAVDK